jgi:hypothetical protein
MGVDLVKPKKILSSVRFERQQNIRLGNRRGRPSGGSVPSTNFYDVIRKFFGGGIQHTVVNDTKDRKSVFNSTSA